MEYDYELQHHGVKGMKWGVRNKPDYTKRTVRGHGGPGQYTTKKRQLAGDKRDLEGLNKGQHLSVGATKKRQAALDARDKAALEKRIAKQNVKNERKTMKAQKKFEKNVENKWVKSYNKATDVFNSKVGEINKKYGDKATVDNKKYIKEVGKLWTDTYSKRLVSDFGPEPISKGNDWVKNAPFMNMYDDLM